MDWQKVIDRLTSETEEILASIKREKSQSAIDAMGTAGIVLVKLRNSLRAGLEAKDGSTS